MIDLAPGLHRVAGQPLEDRAPPVHDLGGVDVRLTPGALGDEGRRAVVVLLQQLERGHPAPVDELDLGLEGGVVRDLVQRRDGAAHRQVVAHDVGLDHREDGEVPS